MDVIKSSRFWLALAIILGAIGLAILGKVGGTEALAVGASILAGFGVAKAMPGAPKVLLPLALAGALAGCGTWQQNTKTALDSAGAVVEGGTTLGLGAFAKSCEAKARTCGCAPAPAPCPCPQLEKCQADRRTFAATVKAAQMARYAGYVAILAVDEAKAKGTIAALKRLAAELAAAVDALGVHWEAL